MNRQAVNQGILCKELAAQLVVDLYIAFVHGCHGYICTKAKPRERCIAFFEFVLCGQHIADRIICARPNMVRGAQRSEVLEVCRNKPVLAKGRITIRFYGPSAFHPPLPDVAPCS